MPDTLQQKRSSTIPPPSPSESVFTQQDLWYFKTREGNEIGPFRYRCEAQSNLDHFIEQLKHTVR